MTKKPKPQTTTFLCLPKILYFSHPTYVKGYISLEDDQCTWHYRQYSERKAGQAYKHNIQLTSQRLSPLYLRTVKYKITALHERIWEAGGE